MTTILPAERSPLDVILGQVGRGLSETLPVAMKERGQRERGMQSIANAESKLKAAGNDPMKIALAFAEIGAGNPQLERVLGPLAQTAMTQAAARNSGNITQPGEGSTQRNREPMEPRAQVQELPNFLNQKQELQNFPDNLGPQGGPGNAPQPETSGIKQPLMSREKKISKAREIFEQAKMNNIPMTMSDALNLVNEEQKDIKEMNAAVDVDTENRVKSQQTYGKRAVEELGKVYKNPTPEMAAIFQKKGEEASTRGDSEAEINHYLATEAKNFANTITNVKKSVSAPRLMEKIGKAAGYNYKDFESAAGDVRSHLKPLLDFGLYDTARDLLIDLGYGPEERDMIINPLSERGKIVLNKVPSATNSAKSISKNPNFVEFGSMQQPANIEDLKQGLRDLKEADPNFSLLLGRKAFEDKKYDWRMYNQALNELLEEGAMDKENGFKLSADQRTQKGNLDTPPLNQLEKILHGLNLIGR